LFQIVGSFLTFTFHKVGYIDAFKMWWSFNDQFITLSLLSPSVKKMKIGQSYMAIKLGVVFS